MRSLLAAVLMALAVPSVFAAERASRPVIVEPPVLAAPVSPHRNPQAQAVAASRECWRGCQMQCKAEFLACGYAQSGAECLAETDRCDRSCQRQCRNTGDPIIDWPRLWD
jgi:hypothetical protein